MSVKPRVRRECLCCRMPAKLRQSAPAATPNSIAPNQTLAQTTGVRRATRKANRRRFRVAGEALLYNPPCDYLQAGSPSPAVETVGFVVFMPMPQTTPLSCVCVFVAVQ